jgi:hypothetical protein
MLQYILDFKHNPFGILADQFVGDVVTLGRQGGILVDCRDFRIPIVRTTTRYGKPPLLFSATHYEIIDKSREVSGMPSLTFNNAMIEIYTNKYRKMRYHTDQALDLADDSFIGIFTCYDHHPKESDIRTLRMKNKTTNEISEVALLQNSMVLFSTRTNREHVHQIILKEASASSTAWLGITFRLSKTFVQFVDSVPMLHPINKILRLATDEEVKYFLKHKGEENKNVEVKYQYDLIDYTISPSDLMVLGSRPSLGYRER